MTELNKNIDYEREKDKIKDCPATEYEAKIKRICEKIKY